MDNDAWSVLFKAALRIAILITVGVLAVVLGIGYIIGHSGSAGSFVQ